MSKVTVIVDLDNGNTIEFKSDLGAEATPFEMINTLDKYIFPSVVRVLGLRTSEDEAALNAEAVDRANTIIEASIASAAGATEPEAPTPEELKGNPRSGDYIGDELAGIPAEYLSTLPESELSEAAKAKVAAYHEERLRALETDETARVSDEMNRERHESDAADAELDQVLEAVVSAEGEVRVKPTRNRAERRKNNSHNH